VRERRCEKEKRTRKKKTHFDCCCFSYFIRNSLVAVLEAHVLEKREENRTESRVGKKKARARLRARVRL